MWEGSSHGLHKVQLVIVPSTWAVLEIVHARD